MHDERMILIIVAMLHSASAGDTGSAYKYIGNGFCNDGLTPPTRVLTWMLEGACAGDICCLLPECNGVVTDATQCTEICSGTETCTGFMVQDNSMYGTGVAQVCQIVASHPPKKEPTAFGFGWKGVKWDKDISTAHGTIIGGHDTEPRDRCYQRAESCEGLPPCKEGAAYATPPAPCCVEVSSTWGWAFLISLLVGSALYVGGFAAYNIKVLGRQGKAALPHPEFCEWTIVQLSIRSALCSVHCTLAILTHVSAGVAVKGLVEDGVRWTSTQVQNARTGGESSMAAGALASTAAPGYGSTADEAAELVTNKSDGHAGEGDDGSDDSLVE